MSTKKARIRNALSVNILLLGIVSLMNDFSSEMIAPVLPMFITSLGGMGIIVGLIGGLRDSIASILKVACGYWSDKTGKRKNFVVSGYLTSSVFKLLLSFSKVWPHVLIFAGLERVGKGLRTAPRDAIIADSLPEERGKGFGIHRTLDTLGAILGSIFVFFMLWFFDFDFRSIIFLAALIAFLSLIPLYFVKERKRGRKKITFSISLKSLPASLRMFILVSFVFSLANFSYMFFILRAQGLFTGKLSIGIPVLLYILFNVFYAMFATPFGILSDRVGRKGVLIFGYALFSLVSLGFAFLNSFFALVLLFAMYGIVHAIVDGNQRAFVSDLSPEDLKSTALGTFHTAVGLAALPASVIAGFFWEFSPELTFIYGGAVSAISVILFLGLKNKI